MQAEFPFELFYGTALSPYAAIDVLSVKNLAEEAELRGADLNELEIQNLAQAFELHKSKGGSLKLSKSYYGDQYIVSWLFGNQYKRIDNGPGKEIFAHKVLVMQEWFKGGLLHRDDLPAQITETKSSWYQEGLLHRVGKPAVEYISGQSEWYLNGKHHRDNGPAIDHPEHRQVWYQHGRLHRADGPAVVYKHGLQEWWLDGVPTRNDDEPQEISDKHVAWKNEKNQFHKLDGPAVVYSNGRKEWFQNGKRHREGGPAIEYSNKSKKYYWLNKPVSPEHYEELWSKVREENRVRDLRTQITTEPLVVAFRG